MERLAIVLYFPHPVAVKANAVNDFKESDTRGYMGEKGNPVTDGGDTERSPGFFLSLVTNFILELVYFINSITPDLSLRMLNSNAC